MRSYNKEPSDNVPLRDEELTQRVNHLAHKLATGVRLTTEERRELQILDRAHQGREAEIHEAVYAY